MNVPTITMPADEARELYDRYRAALAGKEPTVEDRGILLGYKALAAGRAILNLPQAVRGGGVDAEGLPKLAAARAHWRWCHLDAWSNGSGRFGDTADAAANRRRPTWHKYLALPAGTLTGPAVPGWQPVPPTDPLLLRHLHGDLYAVLAAWDLTPLERAVLAGRFAEPAP